MKTYKKYNYFRKDIMRCILALEYFAIIGIALYNIAKDLNMQNTEKFASVLTTIGFILPLTWLICDTIYLYKTKKGNKKINESKSQQN